MEIPKKISETEEAELKVMTQNMYNKGGFLNVMETIRIMQAVQIVILKKLTEILAEERKRKGA